MLTTLRVAVLCSRRCPGARDLLAGGAPDAPWEVVAALSSDEELAERALFEAAGIPLVFDPIREYYRRRGRPISDLSVRADYDREVARFLGPFRPDLLLFSSYLYVATPALLDPFDGRVINIHGSDLSRLGPDGRPKYLGLRAVRDAILAGERETRATAHWVTEDVDLGPPILRSAAFPVSPLVAAALERNDLASVKAYAFAQQEWMLAKAWGRLWHNVLGLVTAGRAAPEAWGEAAAAGMAR
jgi:phosphoribosylglycinamide formyltransferase-1